jgi:hypothetical protein
MRILEIFKFISILLFASFLFNCSSTKNSIITKNNEDELNAFKEYIKNNNTAEVYLKNGTMQKAKNFKYENDTITWRKIEKIQQQKMGGYNIIEIEHINKIPADIIKYLLYSNHFSSFLRSTLFSVVVGPC